MAEHMQKPGGLQDEVLASIDYAKAFNRMSYQHCLKAFKNKGSSTDIPKLLSTFLTNRHMTVRVGKEWSDPLQVNGGCPKGSVQGIFMLNVTKEDLEDPFIEQEKERIRGNIGHEEAVEEETTEANESMQQDFDDSLLKVGSPDALTPPAAPVPLEDLGLSPVGQNLFHHSDLILEFNK